MELSNKVILATGGSGGIGKATCELFATFGAKVSICDVDVNNGEAFAKQLNEKYGSEIAIFNRCDVRDIDKFRECFRATVARFGRVDVVFNNAGIFDDTLEGWDREIDINLKGVLNGFILAIEFMGKNNGGIGGTVISTGSIAGLRITSIAPIYGATKAAIVHLTRAFGILEQFEMHNIKFMCVCPNVTMTNMISSTNVFPGIKLLPMENYTIQTAENVARSVEHAYKHGKNGSVWLVQNDQPAQEVHFKDVNTEGPSFDVEKSI